MTERGALRRVLYLEDNRDDARALTDFAAAELPAYAVPIAPSVDVARALMAGEPFDAILIGVDVEGAVELWPALAGQTVIVLVPAGGEAAAAELLGAGAADFLIKDAARSYLAMLSWRIELALRQKSAMLAADKARLRAVLDASLVATALNDDDQRITFVNAAFVRTFGYELEDIPTLAAWWPKAYPDADYRAWVAESWQQRIEQSRDSGDVFQPLELTVRCRDGRDVTALVSAAPLTGVADGEHMVLLYDISARTRAEADLQAAARWQHALVTHAGDVIVSTDLAGNILTFNPAAERMLGYAASEMIGRTPAVFHDAEQVVERAREFSHELGEEILPGFDVFVAKAIRELPNRHDWTFIRKDGSRFQVSLAVTVLRGASGEIEGFMGVATDLTSRLQAESALRASEARYRTIVEAEPECVKVVSASGELLEMNPAGLAMLEADTLDDVRGRGLAEFIVPEHRAAFSALHKQAMGGVPGLVEFEVVGLHGTRRWLETHAAPLPDADGRVDKILGITRDITSRRQAIAEQAALQAQLAQAQKLESIGRLAGGVAHDFNNMLGVILGHAEMALQEVSPDQPCYLDLKEIQNAAQRSAALTRQLLAFARKQPIEPQLLDLNSAVAATLSLLQRLIGENITMEWQPSAALWPVWMDPSQLDQILTNLCVNARDAIATKGLGTGTVTITTKNVVVDTAFGRVHPEALAGDFVCVAVSDTGRGMEPAIVQHVFEPFFTTKRVGEGTGLGLATVDGAVRQNRGFITVQSVVSAGTTFEIFLPRHAAAARATSADASERESTGGHGTILVVEDEPSILKLTRTMLGRLGYDVLAADGPTAAMALAAAHTGPIDLLLTDVIMPGMNGSDLAGALRKRYRTLQVLFMSGYTADIISDQGVMDDAVHFVQKPFTARDLQIAVESALADRSSASAS